MFILSKLLLFLLFPITWVFIIFIIAFTSKNTQRKQRTILVGLVVFYLFSTPALLDLYAKLWSYPSGTLSKSTIYSCAIILGGFSSEKANGTGYFNGASDRFIQALKLKASGQAAHILITSGNASIKPDGFSEGVWVGSQLKELNVPDSSVLVEGRSRNTIENALFSKQLLMAKHLPPPYILVTSNFHMRRAMLIFKKTGLDVIPYPCGYSAGVSKWSLDSFLPSAATFREWELYTKELLGITVAWLHKY